MALQKTVGQQNSFLGGIVSDGNLFTVPENAVQSMVNVEVGLDGAGIRRRGMSAGSENEFTGVGADGSFSSCESMWIGAGLNRNLNLIAVQVGQYLAVYGQTRTDIYSQYIGKLDLSTIAVGVSTTILASHRWRMTSGEDGALYITTGCSKPVRAAYDDTTFTISAALVDIKVRDTYGVDDGYEATTEPTTLSASHHYNLLNQGWDSQKINTYQARGGGYSTWILTTAYTVDDQAQPSTPNGYYYRCLIAGTSAGTEPTWPTTLGVTVVDGTITWMCYGTTQTYPSNAQQWWAGKDANGNFSPSLLEANTTGNSASARGKYIYSLYNINRSSYIATVTDVTIPVYYGFSGCAFYANRLFLFGFDNDYIPGLSNSLYYSQIIADSTNSADLPYQNYYSDNDPTVETYNDILATDGGTVVIPGLGNVFNGFVLGNALLLFTTTGVWSLGGEAPGTVFKAGGYDVSKMTDAAPLARDSITKLKDAIHYWSKDGIVEIKVGVTAGTYSISNLTDGKYSIRYRDIIAALPKYTTVRQSGRPYGFYDEVNGVVEWIGASDTEPSYSFDAFVSAIPLVAMSASSGDTAGAAYGNGTYVTTYPVATNSCGLMYSKNRLDWVDGGTLFGGFTNESSLQFLNGGFILVGGGSATTLYQTIFTSPDGINWTEQSLPATPAYPHHLESVTYGGGQYIAVGNNVAYATSPDGVTWSWQLTLPATYNWETVIWDATNLQFLVFDAGGVYVTSTDGLTWSAIKYTPFYGVSYAKSAIEVGGQITAVATVSSNNVGYSTDGGATWNTATVDPRGAGTFIPKSIAYGNGKYMVVGYDTGYPEYTAAESTDGITWTRVATPTLAGASWTRVAYGDGCFFATGSDTALDWPTMYSALIDATVNSSGNYTLRYNLSTRAFTELSYNMDRAVRGLVNVTDTVNRKKAHYMLDRYSSGSAFVSWGTNTGTDFLDVGNASPLPEILTWPIHAGAPERRKQVTYLHTYLTRTEQQWTAAATYDYPSECTVTVMWGWADKDTTVSKRKTGPTSCYRFIRPPTDPGSGYPVDFVYERNVIVNKTKLRGHGESVQFYFTGAAGKDMQLLGWTVPLLVES